MKGRSDKSSSAGKLDAFSSATEMLLALRQHHVSAVELLDLHLRRIEHYNPTLNAVVTWNDEAARRTAAKADKVRAQREDRPLLGLPLTIKDCIYVEGLPTTGGVPERVEAIADADAPVAARVRAAGAVIMGKTNVPPYAMDFQAANPLFGRTNNPWNLAGTPGGSTGGGAAAVAAGLTPLEFGGDLGGSVRIPAAFCGIYGHTPSGTAVPRRGHFPGPNTPNPVKALIVLGPLARSAEDLELAFDVIAGPDIGEDAAWHLEVPLARRNCLADYRVAVMPPIEWLPADAEIMEALDRLATQLGRVGVYVKEARPKVLGDMREYYRIYHLLGAVLVSKEMPRVERDRQAEAIRNRTDNPWNLAYADGLQGDAADYIAWFAQREQYRAGLREFFDEWDILLSPANIVNAFPHTDVPPSERRLDVNGESVWYGLQNVYASLSNLSDHPATVFPVGQTRSGLPIGLQALGPYLEDRTSIRFAALVGQEFGGFRAPPGYE
jgi:amidase